MNIPINSKTLHSLNLNEAINRVLLLQHIKVLYTGTEVAHLLGIKNNCLYVFHDGQPDVIPLRNHSLTDFRCWVDNEHLMHVGDELVFDAGGYLVGRIVGFRLGLCTAPIEVVVKFGAKQENYSVSRLQVVHFDNIDDEDSKVEDLNLDGLLPDKAS